MIPNKTLCMYEVKFVRTFYTIQSKRKIEWIINDRKSVQILLKKKGYNPFIVILPYNM